MSKDPTEEMRKLMTDEEFNHIRSVFERWYRWAFKHYTDPEELRRETRAFGFKQGVRFWERQHKRK